MVGVVGVVNSSRAMTVRRGHSTSTIPLCLTLRDDLGDVRQERRGALEAGDLKHAHAFGVSHVAVAAVRDEQLGSLLVAAVAGKPDRVASGQRLQIVHRVEQLLSHVGGGGSAGMPAVQRCRCRRV